MRRIELYKVEKLSKFSQLILLDQRSVIVESCDSIFDTYNLRNIPATTWFPFLESIYEQLNNLEVNGPEIKFAKVEKPFEQLSGYYDFTFSKILLDNENFILWSIYDYTDLYIDFMEYQQKRNELEIHRQRLEISNKKLHSQKDILAQKNMVLENIQSIHNDYNNILHNSLLSPINILDGLTNLLANPSTMDDKKFLSSLKESAEHLQSVIDELESISVPFNYKNTKEKEEVEFELIKTLVDVFDTFRDQVKNDVQLSFHIDENIPERLNGNPVRLKRIIYSLLLNSHKNDKDAAIQVIVSSTPFSQDVSNISFQISEKPKEGAKPQIDINRKEQIVRLSVVKKLIKIQGGEISIKESSSNNGINISCELPYKVHSTVM